MTKEAARIIVEQLDNYLSHTCQDYGERDHEAMMMAIKALEQQPYEKFESTKDHIYKLAGDYKCWDNRLTENEAVELCHILEQQPCYNPDEWCHNCSEYDHEKHCCPRYNKVIRNAVEEMKEAKVGHCKDCKYFEYDHFENMGGIPLITAHKVCKRHGLICKTDEDGYCHLWEHKAESEE